GGSRARSRSRRPRRVSRPGTVPTPAPRRGRSGSDPGGSGSRRPAARRPPRPPCRPPAGPEAASRAGETPSGRGPGRPVRLALLLSLAPGLPIINLIAWHRRAAADGAQDRRLSLPQDPARPVADRFGGRLVPPLRLPV